LGIKEILEGCAVKRAYVFKEPLRWIAAEEPGS